MNPSTQAGLFAVLAVFIIGVLAVARRAGRVKLPFLLFCLALLLVHLGSVLLRLTGDWWSLSFLGGMLLPLAAVALIASVLGIGGVKLKWALRISLCLVVIAGLTNMISELDFLGGPIETLAKYYPQTWLVSKAVYVFGPILMTLVMLAAGSANEPSALLRRQLRGIFVTGIVACSISIAAMLLGGETWPTLAVLSQVMFLYVFYLAFLERSRLSLAELLGKLAAFLASALILTLVFGLLVYWVGNQPLRFALSIFAASFLVLILFEPMVGRIARGFSALFQRDRLVMGRMLSRLQSEAVGLTEPEQLEKLVTGTLAEGVGARSAALYAISPQGGFETIQHGPAPNPSGAPELIDLLRAGRGTITTTDLSEAVYDAVRDGDSKTKHRLNTAREALEELGFEVVVPIKARDRLLGAWMLTPAREGAYGAEEVEILSALGNQIGLKLDSLEVLDALRRQERLATMGQMAAGLAHELKNPLGSLSGAADMIDVANLPQDQQKWHSIITEDTRRLKHVLDRFLDYARPAPLNRETFDPLELARRICDLLRADPAMKEVNLDCRAPQGDIGPLVADPDQVGQVLINLILNAGQSAHGDGAKVDVLLRTESRLGKLGVVFDVQDNGPGIDPADAETIFKPFFTKRRGGTGLGLATCKRIVEAHGGTIEVGTDQPTGALLRFWLPAEIDRIEK